MFRRDSRGMIANIQEDTLLEFENYKKKFLLANRHITKLNSTLSVRIEELNGQLSALYAENLRLRASEIALATQLKREKEKSYKIMMDTESATMNLLKQLGVIRQSFKLDTSHEMPPQPLSPLSPKAKQPPNKSPTQPRLAQPPSVPGISEDPEPPSSCDEGAMKSLQHLRGIAVVARAQSASSKLPLPSRVSSPPLVDETHYNGVSMDALSKKRGPLRRHSGLLSVQVENLPRPSSPALGSPLHQTLEMISEGEYIDETAGQLKNVKSEEAVKSTKKKSKSKDRETAKAAVAEKENISKTKDNEHGESKLKDVTNSSRRRSEALGDVKSSINSSKPLSETLNNQEVDPTMITDGSQSLVVPTIVHPSGSQGSLCSDDDNGNSTGRERRARKSVNYAEPKLNTKMRKPDGHEANRGRTSLSSAKSSRKSSVANDIDQEATSDSYPPLPSPPLTSSSPQSQTTQIDPRGDSPLYSPSLLVPPHMMTITKRKKLPRPNLRTGSDDENDDGVDADAEYGDNKSSLSSNAILRRKSSQNLKANAVRDSCINVPLELED